MLAHHLHQRAQEQQHHEEGGGGSGGGDDEQDDELDRDHQPTLTAISNGGGDDELTQDLAQLRVDEHAVANTSGCASGNDSKSKSNNSVNNNSTSGASSGGSSPLKHAASAVGVLELLHEELKLNEIAPRKLLRQFSLNIPPSATSVGIGNGCETPSDFRSAILSRNFIQHGSPSALGDVLERWEINHVKWRHHGSSQSLAGMENRENQNQQGEADQGTHVIIDGASGVDQMMPSPLQVTVASSNSGRVQQLAFANTLAGDLATGGRLPPMRSETFEVKFGHGFLGIEFVVDETRNEVVVKSVQAGAWSTNTLQIPPYATISRGLIVDAINGREVGVVNPEEILDMLQYTARPITVRFRKNGYSAVVCKLCECKVDAANLDEHTNYCVMSKRFELEADQINNALTKLAASIKANLQADSLRTYFHPEDLHFYNALRVVAIQVRGFACVATKQVDSLLTVHNSCLFVCLSGVVV